MKLLTLNFFVIGTLWDLLRICADAYNVNIKGTEKAKMDQLLSGIYKPANNTNIADLNEYESEYKTTDCGISWSAGSDKQIDWADRIVQRYVKKMNEMIASSFEEGLITEDEGKKLAGAIGKSTELQDDANWWIDNRDEKPKDLTMMLLEDDPECLNIAKKLTY